MTRVLFSLLLCLFLSTTAFADDKNPNKPLMDKFGDMLSPGALAKSHKYLETTTGCVKCHDLNAGVTDANCLTCHKEVQSSLDKKKGYHGSLKKRGTCQSCHKDHKGRDFISYDVEEDVHHEKFGYPLKGAHRELKCTKCHKSENMTKAGRDLKIDGKSRTFQTYQGLVVSCDSCHTVPHGKQFDDQFCKDCHSERSWSDVTFDHNKDSDFPIKGKHKNLTCKACHFKSELNPKVIPFVKLPGQCSECHEDSHDKARAERFKNCNTCHQATGWNKLKSNLKKNKKFDHEKSVFPLGKLHKKVACEDCHPNKKYKLPNKSTCETCHIKIQKIMKGDFINHLGERADPDPMYRSIKCEGCHSGKDHNLTFKMIRKRCVDCHGKAFGDLWDHRVERFGTRKRQKNSKARIKQLQKSHRFADELPKQKGSK